MQIPEIYKIIGLYVEGTLNDPSIKVYPANDTIARLAKPFVIVLLNSFRIIGTPVRRYVDNSNLQEQLLYKRFSVTLKAFADDLQESERILYLLHDHLTTYSAGINYFKGDIRYSRTLTPVTSISTSIDEVNESQSFLELEFQVCTIIEEDAGLIETVIITNEDTGEEITINK